MKYLIKIITFKNAAIVMPFIQLMCTYIAIDVLYFNELLILYPVIDFIIILVYVVSSVNGIISFPPDTRKQRINSFAIIFAILAWNIVINSLPLSNVVENYAFLQRVNRTVGQIKLVKWCEQVEQTPVTTLKIDHSAHIWAFTDNTSYPLIKSSIPPRIRSVMHKQVYSHVRLCVEKNGTKYMKFVCYEGLPQDYGLYVGRDITPTGLGDTTHLRLCQWSHSIIAWYDTSVH